jgi:beta-glucosidase
MMAKVRGKVFNITLASVIAVLVAILIVANVLVFNVYTIAINSFFTKFELSDENVDTKQEDWYGVAKELESEGAVLLKNKNNTLPLKNVTKVNLLGYRSYNHVYSGTGSGATDSSNAITLTKGLEAVGITANPALEAQGIYTTSFNDDTEGMGLFGRFMGASFSLDQEPDIAKFSGSCSFESLKAYSDVAILTLGRIGGEGSDLTEATSSAGGNKEVDLDGAETYLKLSDSEKELLTRARATFDTLIVLVNSGNAMELGCLEDYNVDAALWVGDVGCRGMAAVAEILVGNVTPSGHLPDTYAYDSTSAPSYVNFGLESSFSNYNSDYINYAEGIYVGYRWYETADAEGFYSNVSNEYGTGYKGVVQYPFGYGLSYTTFSQEITGGIKTGSTISAKTEINLEVTTKNTGSEYSGKATVQVYLSAPYTNGGLEKSAVELLNYEKTPLLAPGDDNKTEFTFNASDLASYDSTANNGKGAYVLEKGTYTISVRSDAHTVLDSITLEVKSDIVYSESGAGARTGDLQIAVNQFEEADNGMIYLSRKDHFSNYNTVLSQVADTASQTAINNMNDVTSYDASYDTAITETYTKGVDYDKSGELTLEDVKGLSYDDPLWDELLSQLSISDMKKLIGEGGWSTAEIKSVGKEYETHIDSSQGLVRVVGATPILGTAYPSGVVQAATWNKELVQKFAEYYGDEAHAYGVSGLYCPSLNIHRSPYGGRNYEYFSEDPVLSGWTGASFVKGAKNKGIITYMKHFALNEQETNRASACTFANEQSIREVYLRGYEIIVKESNVTAVMTSMNRVGSVWAGAHEGLLTEVLRNEWGFQGMAITDAAEGEYMKAVDKGLRAGNDLWLVSSGLEPTIKTDADIYYALRACKNILYAEANADVVAANVAPWRVYMGLIDAALCIGICVCGFFLGRNIWLWIKNKK